jgi:two-component system OmpR family response regulator
MPKLNGYELVEKLRSNGDNTPVIFLTARNQRPDISMGFALGADDYVAKPFGLEELLLRTAAILRRTAPIEAPKVLRCGPIYLDTENHLVSIHDEEIPLSPTEFRLLSYLMEHKNKVLTKNSILDSVWGMGFLETAGVLDTFISYLRKKLHRDGFEGIVTVRGVGYKIVDSK